MRSHKSNDNKFPKCGKSNGKARMLIFSLFLLAAGTILILGNAGVIEKSLFEYIFSWQSLLIAFGILILAGGIRKHWFGSLIMISIGGIFLYDEIYSLETGAVNMIWPILLIIVGIAILIKIFIPTRSKFNTSDFGDFSHHANEVNNDEYINVSRVFSGANLLIQSENFKGGTASFIFGGGELDLRSAKLAEGINILKIECIFGGIKLFLPDDWDVTLETSGVFGGFNDERRHVSLDNIDRTKKLVIKAEAVFGGGEIQN